MTPLTIAISGPGPSWPDGTAAFAPVAIALVAVAVAAAAMILVAGHERGRAPAAGRQLDAARQWFHHARPLVRGLTIGMLLTVLALAATAAHAEGVADHLQCYKVTDATRRRLKGIVDLDAPSMGVAPGCRLSRAKLYCVPAKAHVQPGTLFDGSMPLTELPYHGPPAETDRICYDVSCPSSGTTTDETVTDRFGTHVLKRRTTEMVCTPATGGTLPPPASGFQIKSPPIDLAPNQTVTYCYYFRTPNTVAVPVKRWVSELAPGTRSVVMFTTKNTLGQNVDRFPAGTVTTVNCGVFSESYDGLVPRWLYDADTPSSEMTLPADDGAGHPVAIEIPPNSAGFLMMHHVNPTAEPITTRVTLNAEALDDPIYTTTDTFTAYTSDLAIPPQTTGYVQTDSCTVPTGAQFWRLSTHAHKQAVRTSVLDDQTLLFESLDWAHPGARTWPAPPFHTFASTKLTYACTYDNPTTRTIRTGESEQSEEECIAVGYFFPATRPKICYNGFELQ